MLPLLRSEIEEGPDAPGAQGLQYCEGSVLAAIFTQCQVYQVFGKCQALC